MALSGRFFPAEFSGLGLDTKRQVLAELVEYVATGDVEWGAGHPGGMLQLPSHGKPDFKEPYSRGGFVVSQNRRQPWHVHKSDHSASVTPFVAKLEREKQSRQQTRSSQGCRSASGRRVFQVPKGSEIMRNGNRRTRPMTSDAVAVGGRSTSSRFQYLSLIHI